MGRLGSRAGNEGGSESWGGDGNGDRRDGVLIAERGGPGGKGLYDPRSDRKEDLTKDDWVERDGSPSFPSLRAPGLGTSGGGRTKGT